MFNKDKFQVGETVIITYGGAREGLGPLTGINEKYATGFIGKTGVVLDIFKSADGPSYYVEVDEDENAHLATQERTWSFAENWLEEVGTN